MSANHEWYPRHPRDEMSGVQRVLTCEQVGFLDRLRDFSWVNGGLPADENFLKALAKTFGVSSYKFAKLWPVLVKFFEETDEVFFYPEDEAKRQKTVELIAKRKWAGKLGAEARWRPQRETTPDRQILLMANGLSQFEKSDCYNPYPTPNSDSPPTPPFILTNTKTEREPPPPPTPSTNGGGGGAPPQSLEISTTEADIQQVQQRAIDLGMAAPRWELAVQIRQKFSSVPVSEVLGFLVRWEGQQHPGLWASKRADEFRIEAARQARGVPRKPSQRELDDARMLARARERDAGGRS